MRLILLSALLAVACNGCRPTPPAPPPDVPGATCEGAGAHLAELGGCGMDLTRFVSDCHDTERAEVPIGERPALGCLMAAPDCGATRRCR